MKPSNEIYRDHALNLCADLWDMLDSTWLEDAPEIAYKTAKIELCNDPSNFWNAKDLINRSTGELHDGFGRFWHCNSRLCPSCLARFQGRNRKRLRSKLENRQLSTSEHRQLITLTIPKIDESLQRTRDVVDYAWKLFRKRKWFTETILAGSKTEEFTITPKGYHYHLHLLAVTKYIFYSKIRSIWTECVRSSFLHHNIPFSTCSDDLVNVNVKKVYSLKNAIREVTKYITKSSSWSAVRDEDLIALLTMPRFPRMFELFGEFRHREALTPCSMDEEDSDNKDYLDKKHVSDGTISEKRVISRFSLLIDLEKLRDCIIDISAFRIKQLKVLNSTAKFTRKDRTMHASFDRVFNRCGRATRSQTKFHNDRELALKLRLSQSKQCRVTIDNISEILPL